MFSSQRLVEIVREWVLRKGTWVLMYFSVSLVSMLDVFSWRADCDDNRELRSSETMSPLVRVRLANEMMRRPPSS